MMETNDVFHCCSRFHSSLWVVPPVCYTRVGEANDLMLGLHCATMGGGVEGGNHGAFPIWPGFLEDAFSSKCSCGIQNP
jgi:hypothetical protein